MRFYSFILMVFVFFGLIIMPNFSFGDTEATLRAQMEDISNQIKELDKQIAQYQGEIDKTSQESTKLSAVVKELTITRDKLLAEKKKTEKKITATGIVIKTLTNDISGKEKSINLENQTIGKLIYALYQSDNDSFIEKILSKESLNEADTEYNNSIYINDKLLENITELEKIKEDLNVSKSKKITEEKTLKSLQSKLTLQQQAVEASKQEKNKLLTETKNKQAAYEKLLAEQIKKRDAFEKQLGSYEDQLKFILNPSLLPDHNVLSWPLEKILITQQFGKTSSSGRLYRSGLHSGVDFKASTGTEVMAMAGGTVVGVGDTDDYCPKASFGKWVFIKYNDGLSSTFGHLSAISAHVGQKVEAGDVVALSGNTGHSTGPHLHVTIYASQGAYVGSVPSITCDGKSFIMPIAPTGSYLDPLIYLPKTTASMFKK